MLKFSPAVFAVGREYHIMAEVRCEAFMSVRIGERFYHDEVCGIMRSKTPVHRVIVPMDILDEAKNYTVILTPVEERKPYFTTTAHPREYTFSFRPVPDDDIYIYHISDAHNRTEEPIIAGKTFGKIDLLVLNGDIIESSNIAQMYSGIYHISSELTHGQVPVVFARGNHDMRGSFAEKLIDYIPSQNQKTYYTFRVGGVWGMVLDCGEDKWDTHEVYNVTVSCHNFRQKQTDFIKEVIENAAEEYNHPDVKHRLIISHNPFTHQMESPFDIEKDIYASWASLIREHIKPDFMLCGHTHQRGIHPVGGSLDDLGQPCLLIIGSEPRECSFIGFGMVLYEEGIELCFTDSNENILRKKTISHQKFYSIDDDF